jgi:hypothetical protein
MSNFIFIADPHIRNMVSNGYTAVTQLGLWDWLRTSNTDTFMFFSHPNVIKIGNKMESLPDSPGHSGNSFGFTMRNLEYIAKHGLEEYEKQFASDNNV